MCSGALMAQNTMNVNLFFNIKNLPADEEVQLAYRYGDKSYIREELGNFQNGAYGYQSDSVNRGVYLLNFKNKNAYFEFILNEPVFSIIADYNDLMNSQGSLGSKENEVFFGYVKKGQEVNLRISSVEANSEWDDQKKKQEVDLLIKEMEAYRDDLVQQNPELLVSDLIKVSMEPVIPEVPAGLSAEESQKFQFNYYRDHFFDHVNFTNSALLYSPALFAKMQVYRDQLTYHEPDSLIKAARHLIGLASVNKEVQKFFIMEFFNYFAKSKTVCMDKAYVAMADEYYASGEADWIDQAQLEKIIENANNLRNNLCGEKAFNFTLKDANGKSVSLSSVQAQWTILVFLKSDCAHCDRELKNLKSLNLPEVDYKIVTVHLKDDEGWQQQMEGFKDAQWVNLTDAAGLIEWKRQYNLNTFPLIYVLDKEKIIKYKKIGADQIPDLLK